MARTALARNICKRAAALLCRRLQTRQRRWCAWTRVLVATLAAWMLAGAGKAPDSVTPDRMIRMLTEEQEGEIVFFAQNMRQADVTVTIEMALVNLKGDVSFPYTASVRPGAKARLFALRSHKSDEPWRWEYTYFSTWGCREAVHDSSHMYLLPYGSGSSFRVSQGHDGKYSHKGGDRYAIDWRMPAGTPVRAARAGLVAAAKDDSTRGGPDRKFDWDANYVLIRHDDGTYGHYVHLSAGGNRVKVGERVEAGEEIGLSGNTGHSTGPHLHFAVFTGESGHQKRTVPIRFLTADGTGVSLREGRKYKAR